MPQENSDWTTQVSKVVALERKTGCANTATTCGLEAFVERHTPDWSIYVRGYQSADAPRRRAMLARLERAMKQPSVPVPASEVEATASIARAKGVGAKRAQMLARLGVETLEDLLLLLPRRLEDRTRFLSIGSLHEGIEACVRGSVRAVGKHQTRHHRTLVKATLSDGTGFLDLVWFNQPWIADRLKPGTAIDVFGRVERAYGRLQMSSPVWEPQGTGDEIGGWIPIYPATDGLSAKAIRALVHHNLPRYLPSLTDALPATLRSQLGLLPRADAIRTLHRPPNEQMFERARKSLAFEEFYLLQIGLQATLRAEQGRIHQPKTGMVLSFLAALPFRLTLAQRTAVDEIRSDLSSPRRMMRLLQGDVGSGKTVVALIAALLAVDGGCQVAYMAPTEILAGQITRLFQRYLSDLPITVEELTGSTPMKEAVQKRAASGEINLLVGTHALIQEATSFHDLGLIIIDEQHRFGVVQRSAIEEKGHEADLLVMSATPIPRTITLTLYGQFDLSILDELPMGSRSVQTRWMDLSRRDALYQEVEALLEKGGKGYVVLPLVEESEKVDAGAAVQVADELSLRFRRHGVGLIHGRLSSEEKAAAMQSFRDGTTRVLVATTVIEVGIDVQDADFMVIENAERFGLSQLHQLRGRIGRAGQPAWCFALADGGTEDAKQRLSAFEAHSDGFALAEEDLKIRGPGDVIGTQQHGYFTLLRAVNLSQDLDLMRRAREAAKRTFAEGVPPDLLRSVEHRFGEMMRWIRV